MRKAIAIYCASEEVMALIPILESNPEIEIAGIFDDDPVAALERARSLGIQTRIDADASRFGEPLHAVIDASDAVPFSVRFPEWAGRGLQIVSPLTAKLLWGYGSSGSDHKSDLLQALHEVVESVNLTVDADELFGRMLEIAMGVTGADGGSVMLLDADKAELRIRVAIGVEPELWPKIRVPLGEGVAGRVAADARPMKLRGRADREHFNLVRERLDVESALCVPLVHEGRVLGVLNLHHRSRPDAFDDDDLEFAEQLGRLDAEIIARAQEHEALRRQASRYEAVRAVRDALTGSAPLDRRLENLCTRVAELVGGGIATIYLYLREEESLRLTATSLSGGGLGGEYRVAMGQGIEGRVARTLEPIFLAAKPDELGLAGLPLVSGGVLLGVLSVQGGEQPPSGIARGAAVREALLEIAAAAAEEIAQAEREARMSARATKASAINEAGIRLISARESAEVARLATASGALILEADHAILRLQDRASRRFVIRSYYGSADGRGQEELFRLDKQVSVDTIKGRHARLIGDLRQDPATSPLAGGLRSSLASPLKREGRVIGTLTLYDKVAPDQFFAGSFSEDDLQIFTRYTSYVERAIENAHYHTVTSQHRNFDEDTGLPNSDYLARRIDQEVARAGSRAGALTLVSCRLENLEELRRTGDPKRADQIVMRTAESLRNHLRDFDVLARTAERDFAALLPDPGSAPEERVTALARAVAEDLAQDDTLADSERLELAFGYAIYPADGRDRQELQSAAAVARIRMV